jgi:mono/diheme cytochrome c family protein
VKRHILVVGLLFAAGSNLRAHDPSAAPITWNREISRIVYERCASCHREGATSFSLMTYQDAQRRATEIKDTVLSRRMPPWGAVKGFGNFRNDQGLTQEQIDLIASWVEGGMTKGNNPNTMPPVPRFERPAQFKIPANAIAVAGTLTLNQPLKVDGLYPEHVPPGTSMQVVAALPDGDVEPLMWLYEYKDDYRHPFLLRQPLSLPAGTIIRGVRPDARILLIPATRITK